MPQPQTVWMGYLEPPRQPSGKEEKSKERGLTFQEENLEIEQDSKCVVGAERMTFRGKYP